MSGPTRIQGKRRVDSPPHGGIYVTFVTTIPLSLNRISHDWISLIDHQTPNMPYPDGSSLDHYIDTQGMGLPTSKPFNTPQVISPMPVKKMTVFSDLERKELKEIFKEALHEYYTPEDNDEWLYRGTY